ncbi:MAG: HAMP domain-containing histidine kinase [Gemmatimonadota bacterium]|nr:HAMP domain-containing histidine kinase [Gemmatimonadota bacterium]
MSVGSPATAPSFRRSRGRLFIGVALALPLLLGTVLVYYAQRARENEARALDRATLVYSSFAAWRFARQSSSALHDLVHHAIHQIDRAPGGTVRLLPADTSIHFSPDTLNPTHPVIARAVRTFRVDYQRGLIVGLRREDSSGAALLSSLQRTLLDSVHDPHQFRLEATPQGVVATLYGVIRTDQERIRTIYGVETDPKVVRETLERVAFERRLLPEELFGRPLRPAEIRVEIATAAGKPLFTIGTSRGNALLATDTLGTGLGGLRVLVALDSALARSLLLGSGGAAPPLRLIMGLLVLAAVLAVLALLHLDRARKLAELQSQFVANVSHELRTPLTHISMFAESIMLARERSPAERLRFATIIHREARRLTHLVDGVMRFASTAARDDRSEPEVVELGAVIHEAVEAFRPILDGRRVEVAIVMVEGVLVRSDPEALRQIIINLLDNAVKFGPKGQTISIRTSAAHESVSITVSDQGHGVPAHERERVFEPFTRLTGDGRPKVPGAGIGLAVVRDLVQRLGGTVHIGDGPGGGAALIVALPATIRALSIADSPEAPTLR